MALCLGLLLVSVFILQSTARPQRKPHYEQMLAAAMRTAAAFDAVKTERIRRGIPLNIADDLNQTGMIFDEFTDITTTLGSLDAKRTATNSNMAALIVDMLKSAGVSADDTVAVNLSGSFPTLNIATLCALDAMGLRGAVITSVGASTYGATNPDFTYMDIEHFLFENGYIGQKSLAYSMGGAGDLGLEMPDDVKSQIQARLSYPLLTYPGLDQNIAARVQLYGETGPVKCLINVGGNLLSFGLDSGLTHAEAGILTGLPGGESGNGLVQHYARRGIPVIHLLNMKGVSTHYGLPYDPVPLPGPGDGAVYYLVAPNAALAWGGVAFNIIVLVLLLRKRDWYFGF